MMMSVSLEKIFISNWLGQDLLRLDTFPKKRKIRNLQRKKAQMKKANNRKRNKKKKRKKLRMRKGKGKKELRKKKHQKLLS